MKRLLFPALLGLALAGCAQQEKAEPAAELSSDVQAGSPAPGSTAAEPSLADTATADPTNPAPGQVGLTRHPAGRSIIYHGDLHLRVEQFEQTTERLDQLLAEHGAVLGTAHETRANGQHQQDLAIKVPAKNFLRLVSAIGRLGHIDSKDIASSDATADLMAAEQAAARLAAATGTAKPGAAGSSDFSPRDAAAAAQNQVQALRQQTQWATLNLHLYQPVPEEETAEPLPAYGPRFAAAFLRGGGALLSFLVALTNVWPLLLLGGLSYWGVRRWRRVQA
jgi:hypothetical protein